MRKIKFGMRGASIWWTDGYIRLRDGQTWKVEAGMRTYLMPGFHYFYALVGQPALMRTMNKVPEDAVLVLTVYSKDEQLKIIKVGGKGDDKEST